MRPGANAGINGGPGRGGGIKRHRASMRPGANAGINIGDEMKAELRAMVLQ